MHRSCGSATTQFPKHDPCARAAAPPARTPARPRTGSAPVGRRRRSVASSPVVRRDPRTPTPHGRLAPRACSVVSTCVTSRHEKRWRGGGAAGSEHRRKGWAEANGPNGALPNPATSAGPGPTGSPRPNALRYSETASANTDLPRHGQPSGGPAHPRDPRATRMHAVLPRPLLSTRVLVLLPPNLPNLA